MKKNVLILLAFLFSVSFVNAQESKQGSEISFEKLHHDYGEIFQTENGEYEFKFKNTGSEPLILTDVRSSCGCTVPEWPRNPILPGQSSSVKVKYNTNIVGPINRQVTITSNAKNSPSILRISGQVKARPTEILPVQQQVAVPAASPKS